LFTRLGGGFAGSDCSNDPPRLMDTVTITWAENVSQQGLAARLGGLAALLCALVLATLGQALPLLCAEVPAKLPTTSTKLACIALCSAQARARAPLLMWLTSACPALLPPRDRLRIVLARAERRRKGGFTRLRPRPRQRASCEQGEYKDQGPEPGEAKQVGTPATTSPSFAFPL
jgi:hypothetical protein